MQVRIAFKKFITTLGIFIISLGIRYFGLKGYFAFEEQIIDATSTYFADLVDYNKNKSSGMNDSCQIFHCFFVLEKGWRVHSGFYCSQDVVHWYRTYISTICTVISVVTHNKYGIRWNRKWLCRDRLHWFADIGLF